MSILSIRNIRMNAYAPVPFWSWNNALDRDELLRQIDDMKSVGCGGFIIHARMGLRVPYLSDEWFSLVEFCLDAAKERGMFVWIYDENGWPSGFAGGELLKDESNLERYLTCEESDRFDEHALAVFVEEKGEFKRVHAPVQGARYRVIKLHSCPSYTDILNPAIVDQFIALTHEQYYKRFHKRFGKELRGFFTDEPQYMRKQTPYTPMLREYWQKTYGEDVLDNLIAIFNDGEEDYAYRVKYYKALNYLFTENYYRRLYDWCTAHGCELTGHAVQENAFYASMWGCAGVATSYEYEHVPAIDQLTLGESARLSARLVGSVAAQTGKKQVLTETFACSGYAATPRALKAVADSQYVHGVNYMCHHLYSYSLSGQGKYDHPPCFSDHMTWHRQFKEFNDYFTRLGYLLAHTKAQVRCTVLSPLQTVYLHYDVRNEKRAMQVDERFGRLQDVLDAHAIEYEISDERIMEKYGKVEKTALRVGERAYDFVIVPDCESLSASTKRILQEYVAAGGKICCAGEIPSYTDGVKDDWSFLIGNTTIEEIAKHNAVQVETDGKVQYTYRVGKDYSFLYIVNTSKEEAHVRVPAGFSRFNLITFTISEASRDITLAAGKSLILVPEMGKPAVDYRVEKEFADALHCIAADANSLPLDKVRLSYDGVTFGEEEPIEEAFDRLLRAQYEGDLYISFSFEVKELPREIRLRREKGKYLCSTLNGRELTFTQSAFDINFEEANLLPVLKTGSNEYAVKLHFYEDPHVAYALYSPEATEGLRNCLVYDTELEPISLVGEFNVENRAITVGTLPVSVKRIDEQGFSFFAGEMRFCANLYAETSLARLRLEGDFCAAEVKVNGFKAGSLFEGGMLDFFLNEGEANYLEITLSSSLRNAMGPFHLKGGREDAISPLEFTMRGMWKDGKCDLYDPAYRTLPFGVRSARLSFGTYATNKGKKK